MPRETDLFWKYVKLLPNKHWNCSFCGKPYAGSATRIKAHLAGVGGYGINDCKDVDGQVRSEARKAMKGKKVVESSSRPDNDEVGLHQPVIASNEDGRPVIASNEDGRPVIASNEDGRPVIASNEDGRPVIASNEDGWPVIASNEDGQPVIASNEDGRRETSFVAMPYLSSNAISNGRPVIASNEDGRRETSFVAMPYLSSNAISNGRPVIASNEDGQPVIASNEDGRRETSFVAMPYLSSNAISTVGASSSDFHPLHEMNVPSQYLPTQNMTAHGDILFWTQSPQSQAVNSNIQPWNLSHPSSGGDLAPQALTDMPPPVNAEEGEPNAEVPEDARTEDAVVVSRPDDGGLVNANVPSLKRKRKERSNREIVNNCCHCRFQKLSTTHATRCRKSSPLLTTELVGKESNETIKKICDYLMEDEIVRIGIYGMGGVGKTAILMHVHNRVLDNPSFNDVFWVTVPQEFSIYELQDEIANVVGLNNLSKVKDMKRRACILDGHLKKKKKSILLLDGMWVHFEVEDVGIPIEQGGLKVVLTTRSLDVCHKMLCRKQVKIEPLIDEDESWNLFLEKLCFEKEITSEVEKIARSIVYECGGLPLGIIEIATHMRGVEKVHEWKGMLRKLKESGVELNVFKTLKLSYVNLGDSRVQQCFLHSMLCYGEGSYNKNDLIESFIEEGLLGEIATRQEQHDEGDIILDKIRKACLRDVGGEGGGGGEEEAGGGGGEEDWHMGVHPLLRDMALQIVTSTTHMAKAYMGLKEVPEEKFWTDRLEKVYLQGNKIKKIPYNISPNCPKLTRLSLKNNMFLEAIHESFFKHLKGLKVLNLSYTGLVELPNTISHLESMEALLLRNCEKLCRIPCVRKLGSLRKLDLRGCAVLEEVPEGMEMLVKLTYLDLLGTKIKALLEGTLGKLVNLQYLVINYMMDEKVNIKLTMAEGLYCSVPNVETFNACVRLVEQNSSQPYDLALSALGNYFFRDKHERRIIIKSCHSIAVTIDEEIGGDGHALLPKNVQVLKVERCDGLTSLCGVSPLDNLEELEIKEWEKLEELGAIHFPNLRRLTITGCSKLKHLLKEGHELRHLQWFKIEGSEELEGINIAAPFLCNIEVYRCPKMKWVVKWQWLATRLPNLRSIKIKDCEQLEEIVGGLPPIGSPCRLTKIVIEGCNNLKRVLMTHDMSHDMSLHVPLLQDVIVKDCMGIEVIIGTVSNMTQPSFLNLIYLILHNLPELKSICEGTVSCLSIQYMEIFECPKLKRLPLLGYLSRSSDDILIDELTWQSLEWDHSPLRSNFEHLALDYGVPNWHDQRICVRIESCDAIPARVDGQIGGDGRNLLPRNVQVLEVGGGSGVTSLSELGPLENLEELVIEEWEKLEELGAVHFPQLEGLHIDCCSKLKRLSVEGQGLPRLRRFIIECPMELEGIDLAAPNLNYMEVLHCHKMKRVVEWDWLTTRLPNLKSIRIYYGKILEEIIGGPLPIDATCCLTQIDIYCCNNMKGVLLTHDMLLHIPSLQVIAVEYCKGIEVIIGTAPNMTQSSLPKLTHLTLGNLPELKRICDRMESCDDIQYIEIYNCPKLKRIPLRLHPLHPLDNGLRSPPPSLGQILIEEEMWQALEWDHPVVRVSLEPFIKFIGRRGRLSMISKGEL